MTNPNRSQQARIGVVTPDEREVEERGYSSAMGRQRWRSGWWGILCGASYNEIRVDASEGAMERKKVMTVTSSMHDPRSDPAIFFERPETITIGTDPAKLPPALARLMAGQLKKGAIPPK